MIRAIAELPIVLPFATFQGHYWNVDFVSKASRSFFSVTLSKDLFDKPRLIDVKLNDGETDRMSVSYDSGGLFPTMTTERDFPYNSSLHSRKRVYRQVTV